jgi:acyl carrier protein
MQRETIDEPAQEALTLDQVVATVEAVLDRLGRGGIPIEASTPLDTLPLDSIGQAELFVALEEAAGRPLDPTKREGLAVVGDLVRISPA